MLRVPAGLAGDRVEQERVDLRERVIAGKAPERERERRIDVRVVQRVARLVQEGLVVVDPSHRAGDEVDDPRRIRGDHAGARRLLRAVVEVGADPGLVGEVEPDRAERRLAHGHGALPGVRPRERRETSDPREVGRRRARGGVRAEQEGEPAGALREERRGRRLARAVDGGQDRGEREALLRLVARDGILDAGELGLERLARLEQGSSLVVELLRHRRDPLAEQRPRCVVGLDREACHRGAQRQLVVLPGHPRGEECVLEGVLPLRRAPDSRARPRRPAAGARRARRRRLSPRRPRPRGARRAARG